VVAVLALAATAGAQSPSPAPSPAPTPEGVLDLEIDADVSWKELRFETVGTPRVEFSGTPRRQTVWKAERRNLPRPVQPGVVYRDGGIHLTISSRFEDLARLFTEGPTPVPAGASPAPGARPSPAAPGPEPSPMP
jgi:hypothetical protein